jgi:hypothetical protein
LGHAQALRTVFAPHVEAQKQRRKDMGKKPPTTIYAEQALIAYANLSGRAEELAGAMTTSLLISDLVRDLHKIDSWFNLGRAA